MSEELSDSNLLRREIAFEEMFKHMVALGRLYAHIESVAPQEAIAGKRVADYLEENKANIRARVMAP